MNGIAKWIDTEGNVVEYHDLRGCVEDIAQVYWE